MELQLTGSSFSFLSDSVVLGARHVNPELFGVTGQKESAGKLQSEMCCSCSLS